MGNKKCKITPLNSNIIELKHKENIKIIYDDLVRAYELSFTIINHDEYDIMFLNKLKTRDTEWLEMSELYKIITKIIECNIDLSTTVIELMEYDYKHHKQYFNDTDIVIHFSDSILKYIPIK